jgi:hypothetical protein
MELQSTKIKTVLKDKACAIFINFMMGKVSQDSDTRFLNLITCFQQNLILHSYFCEDKMLLSFFYTNS